MRQIKQLSRSREGDICHAPLFFGIQRWLSRKDAFCQSNHKDQRALHAFGIQYELEGHAGFYLSTTCATTLFTAHVSEKLSDVGELPRILFQLRQFLQRLILDSRRHFQGLVVIVETLRSAKQCN